MARKKTSAPVSRIGGRVKRLKLTEWMANLEPPVSAADVARATGLEKSQITRLQQGQNPGPKTLELLRLFFNLDDAESLFRLPNEDWLYRLFREADAEEQKRLRSLIELSMPRRA